MANFEHAKATVCGVAVAFLGIVPALYMQAQRILYPTSKDTPHFWIFISLIIILMSIIGSLLTTITTDRLESRISYASVQDEPSPFLKETASPVMVRASATFKTASRNAARSSIRKSYSDYALLVSDEDIPDLLVVDVLPEFNSVQILLTLQYWMLFLITMIVQGSALTLLFNMPRMLESEIGNSGAQNASFILYYCCLSVSALFFGFISDQLRESVYHPAYLGLALIFITTGNLLLVLRGSELIIAASCIMAIGVGTMWSVLPAIVCDLWGSKNFGTNFGTVGIGMALGSWIFPTLVANTIFHRNSLHGTCQGPACHHGTFLTCCICSGVMMIAAVVLYVLSARLFSVVNRNIKNNRDL